MELDDEDTTTWVQTPEDKARLERELEAFEREGEVHDHLKITRPPSSLAQQEEQRRRAEEIVARIAAEKELKAKKTKKALLITGAILVVVAIAVGVVIGVSSSSSNSTPDPTPTPILSQRDSMISLIQSRSASTSFTNSSSPQSQSLDWVLSDAFSSDGLSDDRLVQRFALATLYYSTNGTYWDHDGWLNSTNECDGHDSDDVRCSSESMAEELHLYQDNLSGRIPIEIGLLTTLTTLRLGRNQLTGSIPSELGLLNQLTALHLWANQLTGSLPSELGLLNQLNELYLSRNQLTGSLPSELGLLIQLNELSLYDNDLTGSIPSSLCSPALNATIAIDCEDEIACTCCVSGVDVNDNGLFDDSCPS